MASWVVLATGPSMSAQLADSLRGQNAIVVSNAYLLAPWADAMVSQDKAWWREHPDAFKFQGRKFSCNAIDGVEQFNPTDMIGNPVISTGTNSGLLGCCLAQWFGATRIELYGFDMHGSHFFGQHKPPLKNPDETRFKVMLEQFRRWNHDGIEVINMTPGSALTCFRSGVL